MKLTPKRISVQLVPQKNVAARRSDRKDIDRVREPCWLNFLLQFFCHLFDCSPSDTATSRVWPTSLVGWLLVNGKQ
jgi:hypothetical protein